MPASADYDTLPMDWIGDWAGRRAALTPERPALLDADSGVRLTYRELDERATRTAVWLEESVGLVAGDVICILSRNRLEMVDLYLACGKAGQILAPLSFRLQARELNDLLERMQPAAFVHEAVFDDLVGQLVLPASVRARLRVTDADDSDLAAVAQAPLRPVNRPLAQADTYLYIHTGGTTATPKVCVIPHRQMLWNALDMIVTSGTLMEQRQLITFPLFHIGGWNSLTPMLHAGGFCVITRQFDPAQVLDLVERERLTQFGGVEAMLRFIADHPRFAEADLGSLKGVLSAGAPCSDEVMAPFYDRGIPVTQAYGLTEAGPSNFMYVADGADLDTMRSHSRSVGTAMAHCDYRIVDRNSGAPVAPGTIGVLCMRSLHNFGGYLGQEERTHETLREDGWVYSGDLAVEDEAGYVRIVGRADNMFITGGENVSPEEIENALLEHPAIAQACVIGVADSRWGQVPLAVVVPESGADPDTEALRAHCRDYLAAYKVPVRIEYVEALPVTGAGKLDRNALRDRFDR